MSSSPPGPNPLRPYYIPQSNDLSLEALHGSASKVFSRTSNTISSPPSLPSPSSVFGKDFLPDLSDYGSESYDGSTPSATELLRKLAVRASTRYMFQGLSQPFEVALTVLQVEHIPKRKNKGGIKETATKDSRHQQDRNGKSTYGDDGLFEDIEDSDSEVTYFTSHSPAEPSSPSLRAIGSSSGSRRLTDRAGYVIDDPAIEDMRPPWGIKITKPHIWEVIRTLWAKEGAWGVWKGQNASFIHWFLSTTLESWTTSLLSAILSLPEPSTISDIATDSPYPLTSIAVAVSSAALTSLILSPLDIIKTRLMVTPASDASRSILPLLNTLPSWSCPANLLAPTLLTSTIPSIISNGKLYFIRSKLGIDPMNSPTIFTFLSLVGTLTSKFIRLPLEMVLRRGQIDVMKPARTIVPVGRYAGVFGTMWLIVTEEEGGLTGLEGLFRGWRMEFWPELCLSVLQGLGMGGNGENEGF